MTLIGIALIAAVVAAGGCWIAADVTAPGR